MALWILKDPTGSLNTLLQTNVGTMHAQYQDDDKAESAIGKISTQCLRLIVMLTLKCL